MVDSMTVLVYALMSILVFAILLTTVAFLTLAERRISAFMQDRLGPNRVGPWGLLQPVADGIKFIMKEDIVPREANRLLYTVAPLMTIIPALLTFAVVPFGPTLFLPHRIIKLQIADFNVGILYIFAIAAMGIFGIIIGGWASNNKYSLLGGLRSASQFISYEIAMSLAVIGVLMVYGSLKLSDIAQYQGGLWLGFVPKWGILVQPLGFIIFIVSVYAETNRLPFDLPEAESELVGGYHTEYSSMKFAFFFMGEYANMITASALLATLYFGGWQVPYLHAILGTLFPKLGFQAQQWIGAVLGVVSFAVKVGIFLFLFLWVRWTLPRFRFDQLTDLGWKVLIPLALLNIVVTGVLIVLRVI
ncbi:MAG: NADH-quinone oxidoreductase subunit NuoH [Deltaproteobacteria bacterium]|nr:NADH-quinone oxidoreductase subunit NuoH [Deltaproteobacteria bacterium]